MITLVSGMSPSIDGICSRPTQPKLPRLVRMPAGDEHKVFNFNKKGFAHEKETKQTSTQEPQ